MHSTQAAGVEVVTVRIFHLQVITLICIATFPERMVMQRIPRYNLAELGVNCYTTW